MKTSELIKRLQFLIDTHGDQEVFSGGEDYPGPVKGVRHVERGDGYTPTGCFDICGGL